MYDVRRAIIALFVAAVVCGVAATEDRAEQLPPAPKKLPVDLYDMTERWQFLFGIDGKLTLTKGRKDLREAAADGYVHLSFEAQASTLGFYCFTFVRVDERERVYGARIITVNVRKGTKNSTQMIVTPDSLTNQANLYAAPNEKFLVRWDYYPGGEGIRGGWRLLKTSFSTRPQPLSGFDNARGE